MANNLPAKERVIDFVTKTKMDESYEFTFQGTVTQAERYVHTMRVALSRLRAKVEARGKKRKLFKVLKEIEPSEDGTSCVIRLHMTGAEIARVDEQLSDVLDYIGR